MTLSPLSSRGKIAAFLMTIMLAGVLVVAVAARNLDASFVPGLEYLSTPTHASFYGMVELAKPTYTPTLLIELPIPTETVPAENTLGELVATVESLVQVEVIPDTPMPGTTVENTNEETYTAVPSYGGNKSILVDISEQHMYVYEGDVAVYSFVASTGMNNATSTGSFSVLDKIPNAYGATWDLWMPNWLGIYWAGTLENGIHALPILSNGMQLWAGYLGTPISYGCVVLDVYESQLLYDWADIGTPVNIQW